MNILVPDHIPAETRATWAAINPAIRILPLTIQAHEAPLRRIARAAAARWLPYSTYQGMGALLAPRRCYTFSIDGQPLTDARPDLTALLATWLLPRGAYRALRPYLPNLQWVHSTKTGVDHLLAPALQPNTLRMTCSTGLHSERMAEFVTALIYCFSKRLLEHRALQLNGGWEQLPSRDLPGKHVLVLGAGSIGTAVARRLTPLGMHVIGVSRSGRPNTAFEAVYKPDQLPGLLAPIDYLVAALPLTPETRELLDEPMLDRLKPGCVIINVGRDEVIHDGALLDRLRAGRLSAALEITRPGHIPANHPYNRLRNVLVTHYSSFSGETSMAEIFGRFEANIGHWLGGEPLDGEVDPEAGY